MNEAHGYIPRLMRQLMNREQKTVTELARMLDISRPSLSQVLHGRAGLSIALALKLEAVFALDAKTALVSQLFEDIHAEMERQKALKRPRGRPRKGETRYG